MTAKTATAVTKSGDQNCDSIRPPQNAPRESIAKINSQSRRLVAPVNTQSKKEAKHVVTDVSQVIRVMFDHSAIINKQVEFLVSSHEGKRILKLDTRVSIA